MLSTLFLILLIGVSFGTQFILDRLVIREWASERGWSPPSVSWAPFAPKTLRDIRWTRIYAVRLRDDTGAWREGYCRVCNFMFGSTDDVLFENRSPRGIQAGGPARRLSRVAWLLIGAAIGSFIGAAVGIVGSLALYPTSNIAPAYGLLFIGPLGFIAGIVFGATKRI